MFDDWLALPVLWALSQRLTAFAVLLQSIEWLQVRSSFADTGVWRYALLAPEQRGLPLPLRWLCRVALPYRGFVGLLGLRLSAAGWWLLGGSVVIAPLLLISQLLVCIRFRGTSNGGSDSMTLVLLLAHSAAAFSGGSAFACRVALLYIAVQVTLSYVIAGLVKWRQAEWRQGTALCHFVSSGAYPAPRWLARGLGREWLGAPIAVGVMTFESVAPLAWLDLRVCVAYLAAGACFHVVNAYVFGLNRFFWAWLAGYPALAYGCLYLARGAAVG